MEINKRYLKTRETIRVKEIFDGNQKAIKNIYNKFLIAFWLFFILFDLNNTNCIVPKSNIMFISNIIFNTQLFLLLFRPTLSKLYIIIQYDSQFVLRQMGV